MERKAISIRPKEAEKLQKKSFEISMSEKKIINESDIVHLLINKYLSKIEAEDVKRINKYVKIK